MAICQVGMGEGESEDGWPKNQWGAIGYLSRGKQSQDLNPSSTVHKAMILDTLLALCTCTDII